MTTSEQKNAIVAQVMALGYEKMKDLAIIIPCHRSDRTGIDTTRIFCSLDENKQRSHTTKIKPVADCEASRAARRSDIIAQYVTATCRFWHATVNINNSYVTITFQKTPKAIFERENKTIKDGLTEIFKSVTTLPQISTKSQKK